MVAIAVVVVLAVIALATTFRVDWSAKRPRHLAHDWRRRYNLLVLAEFAIIFLTAAALGRSGCPEWIPVAVCLIVGLHFFPLAGVFDLPAYRWTAGSLCVIALLGAVLLPLGTARAVVGLSAAAALWSTTLRIARAG